MALTLPQAVAALEARTELRVLAGAVSARDAVWLRDGDFLLHVASSPHWLQLSSPAPAAPPQAALEESFRRHLAKLAHTPGGELLLETELPQAGLDATYLMYGVGALRAPVPPATRPPPVPRPGEREIVSESEMLLMVRTLAHEGWLLKDRPATNHYRLGFHAPDDRYYYVHLGLDESWVSFQIPLRGEHAPLSPEARRQLGRYLLAMNHLAYWAKLGIAEGDEAVLSLDLPADCLDLARFRAAVRTLAYYAQLVSSEVHILSFIDRDPVILEYLHA
jgi:hypothetical protein